MLLFYFTGIYEICTTMKVITILVILHVFRFNKNVYFFLDSNIIKNRNNNLNMFIEYFVFVVYHYLKELIAKN